MRIGIGKRLTQPALLAGSLSGWLLMALASSASAQEAAALSAKVVRLTGPVRYTVNGTAWKMLKTGDLLKAGVIVQTARENSSVDLEWSGKEGGSFKASFSTNTQGGLETSANLARLFENSALEIRKLTAAGRGPDAVEESELDLRSGQLLGVVKRLTTTSRYEVLTPSGATGVQPGLPESPCAAFVLKSSGTLTVLAGTMLIAKADTEVRTEVVKADQQFDPSTGRVQQLSQEAPERKLWPP